MIGYFWPHVFASGGADQMGVLGAENDQQLHQRLTNIVARLARDGATGTAALQNCPLRSVPVLEVVADALLDTGAVNTAIISTVTDKKGRFRLCISAGKVVRATRLAGGPVDPPTQGNEYLSKSAQRPAK